MSDTTDTTYCPECGDEFEMVATTILVNGKRLHEDCHWRCVQATLVARDAEIARLRAGFLKCIQDDNECDAWLYGSACRTAENCRCALEMELWCNRAVSKEDT